MEGDFTPPLSSELYEISIHSLRMEGDIARLIPWRFFLAFQSTPSAWRETREFFHPSFQMLFQSTPSAWRETSILPGDWITRNHFNPLPPHGGRRVAAVPTHWNKLFQSTPSAWRETDLIYLGMIAQRNFDPLPPHGGRRNNPCNI